MDNPIIRVILDMQHMAMMIVMIGMLIGIMKATTTKKMILIPLIVFFVMVIFAVIEHYLRLELM